MKLKIGRRRLLVGVAAVVVLLGVAGAAAGVYANSVAVPDLPPLRGSTDIRYADGSPLALVGRDDQLPIDTRHLPPHVAAAVLAAENPGFRDEHWFGRPSRLGVQYTRILIDAPNIGTAKLALIARKVEDRYGKDTILDRYLNSVYFGRYAYGVEAAALDFFGKQAAELTPGEAIVLAAQLDSPGDGAFDPTLHPDAARRRFDEIRKEMPGGDGAQFPAGTLTTAQWEQQRKARHPEGVAQYLADKAILDIAALNLPYEGARVITTIDPRLQQALVKQVDAAADGSVMHGQPANLRAAAVAVQPGTGRILAYYDDARATPGPPGNAFVPITLAAAIKAGISLQSRWLAPAEMDFPSEGRLAKQGNPVRDVKRCPGGKPSCTLLDAQRDGLRLPLFAVASKVGAPAIVDMARACGVGTMWAYEQDKLTPVPLDRAGKELAPKYFQAEIGLGQYPLTLADEANLMATFASGGKRATAHIVAEVSYAGQTRYHADEHTEAALDEGVARDVTWALAQQPAGRLADGRPTAAATGEWTLAPTLAERSQPPGQFQVDLTKFAHASIAGFTPQLAVAVRVGNKGDEEHVLVDRTGARINATTMPAQIYRQFLAEALAGAPRFDVPQPLALGDPNTGNAR
ncbi:hypothetical protein GCM10022255_075780 [Dactylosporangium darangshiense]|uniref:Glycosyl transferase family 51 domain-containing protein n=1 Tax=Dactylosporangium darangshiense TaxID=579108 RepID=A0ABP8DJT1_9ACTN